MGRCANCPPARCTPHPLPAGGQLPSPQAGQVTPQVRCIRFFLSPPWLPPPLPVALVAVCGTRAPTRCDSQGSMPGS